MQSYGIVNSQARVKEVNGMNIHLRKLVIAGFTALWVSVVGAPALTQADIDALAINPVPIPGDWSNTGNISIVSYTAGTIYTVAGIPEQATLGVGDFCTEDLYLKEGNYSGVSTLDNIFNFDANGNLVISDGNVTNPQPGVFMYVQEYAPGSRDITIQGEVRVISPTLIEYSLYFSVEENIGNMHCDYTAEGRMEYVGVIPTPASITVTASIQTPCPNETVTFTASSSDGTISWSGGGNPATGSGTAFTTQFPVNGQRTVTATLTTSEGRTLSGQATITVYENSGVQWVARFPGSTLVSDLTAPFASAVNRFIQALQQAGATVTLSATYRPPERAYLMHYSYRIAREDLDPATVPPHAGVEICWLHRNANGDSDIAASEAAAEAMVVGYRIVRDVRPVLVSRHTQRRAVDMTITWQGDLTITNGNGDVVTITSTPRNGANNGDLHTVGATYGVRKLVGDRPHWSDDGH
jgi:hypothetical protein